MTQLRTNKVVFLFNINDFFSIHIKLPAQEKDTFQSQGDLSIVWQKYAHKGCLVQLVS